MLEAGGNAVDAAVASCFAIGVVEPMSSGIGGGGYLNYQVDGQGGVVGFPMRGPLAAKPDMYKLTGEAYVGNFGWAGVENDANLEGYLSIAVPGAVAGLCEAHRRFGRLPLSEVVAPAASLARDGFTPNWYLLFSLGRSAGKLFQYPELRRVFMPGDNMLPSGDMGDDVRLQPAGPGRGAGGHRQARPGRLLSAATWRRLSRADVQANGGILSEDDLAQYKPFVWEGRPGDRLPRPDGARAPVRLRRQHQRDDAQAVRRIRRRIERPQLHRHAARLHQQRAAGLRRPVRVLRRPRVRGTRPGRGCSRTPTPTGAAPRSATASRPRSCRATPGRRRAGRRARSSPRACPRSTPAPPTCARWTRTATPSRSPTR